MVQIGVNGSIDGLIKKLGYSFKDVNLLHTALTHRSASKNNNERLEYLGDAILGFVIAEILFKEFPEQPEGAMTRLRASLVRKETLANLARSLEIGDYLKLGAGERRSGGWRRDSILANALEAIIGALYLDSNIDKCRDFILNLYSDLVAGITTEKLAKDAKTELQEYLQARKQPLPTYKVVAEAGQAHARKFTVECQIDGLDETVLAQGKNKRIAEQSAARKALELLRLSQT